MIPGSTTEQIIEGIPKENKLAAIWALPPQRQKDRCAIARAGRQGAVAISAPEIASSTKLSRFPVANQGFLGFLMVDICQECHSLRLAPQRRHMAHQGLFPCDAPGKPSSWDQGGA